MQNLFCLFEGILLTFKRHRDIFFVTSSARARIHWAKNRQNPNGIGEVLKAPPVSIRVVGFTESAQMDCGPVHRQKVRQDTQRR